MAIPHSVIEEIKYRSDIESVISSYISLKRRGKNLIGLCPFHGEKTPSFTVYPESASFYCFGCKAGGDVFTFIKLIENIDYIDSVKLLAERAGITVREDDSDDALHKLRNTIYEINREAARYYYSYLLSPEGENCRNYFVSRGLTPETIKKFGLGAAPDKWDGLLKHLNAKGFSTQDIYLANLVSKSTKGTYFDRFRNRAMFPIINVRGNVVGFSGRRLSENKTEAKYVNTSDTQVYKKSQNLFGINISKNYCSESLILVEGNLDVISLHQAGFMNVVAPLGTAFTEEQAQMLSRYTKEVIVCFDSDEAGQKAIEKALILLGKTGVSVKILMLPVGKDPDEFLKTHKPSDFQKLIESAVPATEYKLLKAANTLDVNSDEAKLKYLNSAAEILAATDDSITVDYYLSKLSKNYGVSKTALLSKVSEIRKKKTVKAKKREFSQIVSPTNYRNDVNPEKFGNERAARAEERMLSVLFKHPDLVSVVTENLPTDKMITSLNKRILMAMLEQLSASHNFEISLLSSDFTDGEIGYITMLINSDFSSDNPKTVLNDCIKVILEENMLKKSDDTVDDWALKMKQIADNKKGN
ncbi:MAG: DNA primase [Clostridia bacterium]|nr:DNA primase [Clostridia bacterium]